MKKLMTILMFSLMVLSLVSCNQTNEIKDDETEKKEDSTKDEEKEEGGILSMNINEYIINNGIIEVVINRDNGNICSIRNLTSDRDYIDCSNGGNWAMLVDTKTNNPFKTNPNLQTTYLVSSRNYFPKMETSKTENGVKVVMDYDVSFKAGAITIEGICVKSTLTFFNDSGEFSIDYEVSNDTAISTCIISFTSAIVSGIKDETSSLDLFWPNKEGKIYENAVSKAFTTLKLSEQYPSPFSMQLMQLFNDDEALYYYVCDNTREYKEFNFGAFTSGKGHDAGTVDISDKVSMSCTQYPYISNGNSKSIFKTVIGVSNGNSWYLGSDSYRENLINLGMSRDYNTFVAEWTGFVSDTIARYTGNIKTYVGGNSSDQVVKSVDACGVDSIVLFGWHEGGFDYKYPDYEYIEGEGYGESNFKTLVNNIHANGDKVLPYVNAHIIAENSSWGKKTASGGVSNMYYAATKKVGFTTGTSNYTNYMYRETYGTDIGYYAACPCCDEFVNQILSVVERLADANVDGLWMDQMMEMPAYLCYDESHGHTNPATAYGEGYKKLYSGIDQIFKNHDIEYLIFAEGVTDAWIEYIDIPAYMWGRTLYSKDNVNPGDDQYMHPEITAYTMPCSFLGIGGYNVLYNHAYGFLMGSPLASGTSSTDIIVNNLYINNKDIYFYGRFMDYRGLTINNSKVLGSVIIGNNNRIGIQLYNNSETSSSVTVTIDLKKLGVNGKITGAVDMLTGDVVEIVDFVITLTMDANSISAIALTIGE